MKYLPHFILPPLLLALFAAAMFVPKYFQFQSVENPDGSDEKVAKSEPDREAPDVDYQSMIQPFLASLESRDLSAAEAALDKLNSSIPLEVTTGLRVSLITAREAEKSLRESAKKETELKEIVEAQKKANAEALVEVARIEKAQRDAEKKFAREQRAQAAKIEGMRQTLAALKKATLVGDAQNLKPEQEIAVHSGSTTSEVKVVPEATPQPREKALLPIQVEFPVSEKSLKIPAPLSVHFEGDSITIPDSVSMYVDQMGEWLKKDPRLGIRLLGRLQAGDNSPAQKVLATARSTSVKEALIKNGAAGEQVEIVPLDDFSMESGLDAFGYVDLIFIER